MFILRWTLIAYSFNIFRGLLMVKNYLSPYVFHPEQSSSKVLSIICLLPLQNRSDKNNKCELTIIYLFCENLYTSVVVWAILLKSQLLSLHLLQNIWILDVERKRVHHWIVSVLYLLGVEVIFGVWTCHCSLSDFRWGHSWTWII